jgi:hypothetical protein
LDLLINSPDVYISVLTPALLKVIETLPTLRPKLTLMTTLDEANVAVKKIEEETLAKIREKAPELSKLFEKMSLSGGSPIPEGTTSATLQTIAEDADEDDEAVS